MDGIELLLHQECMKNQKKLKIIDKKITFTPVYHEADKGFYQFGDEQILQIIEFVKSVKRKYKNQKMPIVLKLGKINFVDKLTYILLECICYILIYKYRHSVQVLMEADIYIDTEGLQSSPLLLLNGTKFKSVQKFPETFRKDIYHMHFRRIVVGSRTTNYLGNLMTEISTFLKLFSLHNTECREDIAQVVVELVGNAYDHCGSNCLIDIDVSSPYNKVGEDSNTNYYGINIVVLNFSQRLLGSGICDNIIHNNSETMNSRYADVKQAYEKHKLSFSEQYNFNDFCNISTFQHKISGREDIQSDQTGGTGLTKLIHSLNRRSAVSNCYVISGNRGIRFDDDYLEYNQENWIGFNDENDYINHIPDLSVVSKHLLFLPGTAYNLNFIIEGEVLQYEGK